MPTAPPPRITAVDAYRGFVMLLMLAEVLHLSSMAKAFPENAVWKFLAHHQSHVAWQGCSLHDLIQPSFSFLVGVALPFSMASRLAQQQSFARMFLHALWRSVLLVLLGVFLRSVGKKQTNWTFEDTLSQIGLGYLFLFLLGFASTRLRWGVFVGILVGYWALFACYPLPDAQFDYAAVGVEMGSAQHLSGFEAHWTMNSNPAWAFDRWFLNQFPREKPFSHNRGGYSTLSFLPTLATMLLGLIVGTLLKNGPIGQRLITQLMLFGAILLGLGYGLDQLGICPNVKKIWTPSWVLFSGGWCCLLLAFFTTTTDWIGRTRWCFPLCVIGANSIVAYCADHLVTGSVQESFKTHFGAKVFQRFGEVYEPLMSGVVVLTVYWFVLWWMYRNKIFVRI